MQMESKNALSHMGPRIDFIYKGRGGGRGDKYSTLLCSTLDLADNYTAFHFFCPCWRWKCCIKLKTTHSQSEDIWWWIFNNSILDQWDFTVCRIPQLNVTDRETKHVLSLDMTQLLRTETETIYPASCRSKPGWLSFFHTMKVDGGQEL